MDPKHAQVKKGSIEGDDIWVEAELFLREIEEHGYPFQCKVGNPLVSASSTAIEEQGLLKGGRSP